jgi:outer membrane protein TolC
MSARNPKRRFAGRLAHVLAAACGFLLPLAADAGESAPAPKRQVVNLATVMHLAGAGNLDIRLANERVAEARAQHEAARMQFFPYISPGIAFRRHEGNIQTVDGHIIDADKQSLTLGAAVTLQVEIGEAYYRALIARKLAKAAAFSAEAQRQESVFQAVSAYLEVVRAKAAAGVAGEAVRIAEDYAGQVRQAVSAGIAFKGDAFRATAQVERNELILRQAREQQRVAAARLAQVLHISPSVELLPGDEPAPLSFSEGRVALDPLIAQALEKRPEISMSAEQLEATVKASAGARWAPLVPTLRAEYFGGNLGGGTYDEGLKHFNSTTEYGIGLSWRIGPGGLFDPSRSHLADARQRGAVIERDKLNDEITRQVVEAHTRVRSLAEQLTHARRALEAAEQSLKLARERRAFAVGEVLESILAEQDLTRARLDYLGIVTEHNRAQFLLRRAVGAEAVNPGRKK